MEVEILENLKKAVIEYDSKDAAYWANKSVKEKVDPIKALDALTEVMRQVGDGFGSGELWLPDLIGAADAMKSAMPIIEEEINRKGAKRESLGTVVIGTVFGDIHDLGKTMVSTLLIADGFQVIDLGINIGAEEFVEAVSKHKPDILAMSALMTMTSIQQMLVIATLQGKGIRGKVKIMVGGGAITEEFAKSIGADGYDPSAPGAVKLARRLIGKE